VSSTTTSNPTTSDAAARNAAAGSCSAGCRQALTPRPAIRVAAGRRAILVKEYDRCPKPRPNPTEVQPVAATEEAADLTSYRVSGNLPLTISVTAASAYDAARRVPVTPDAHARWRAIWAATQHLPAATRETARAHGVSVRTLQFIRAAGEAGHLTTPSDHPNDNGAPADPCQSGPQQKATPYSSTEPGPGWAVIQPEPNTRGTEHPGAATSR
jgi:hypothetical protein